MVRLGNEKFLASPARYAKKKRIGLVVNQTSFTPDMRSVLGESLSSPDIEVTAVFTPEHGLFGAAQDMETVGHARLAGGTPVFSLYGADEKSLRPTPEAMDLVDALVFDIQDVGSRYYTFVWTMALCMKACAEAGRSMIVLDRPNPLNGETVSGPVQKPGFCSFVGLYPVPVRHGLTAGEIARLLRDAFGIACDLTVVTMEGWDRKMWWDHTRLPWIPPSPNMPSLSTAVVYPGGCLIEGTTLSEGRGTTTPFELIGAPGIDAFTLASRLASLKIPGCVFRPMEFVPAFQKHAGHACAGVFVHVTDRSVFDAFVTYCRLLETLKKNFPGSFDWRRQVYEFVEDIPAVDLLFGSDQLREGLDRGLGADEILGNASAETEDFLALRAAHLLY